MFLKDKEKEIILMNQRERAVFLPFILTFLVILADQVSKLLVLKLASDGGVITSFFGDFLRIVLVYNTGAAFSLGNNFAPVLHFIVLKLLPLVVIIGFIPLYFKADFTLFERYILASILGGGIGNLIDRFFRTKGVVDFIDVKFYGLFGLDRWPTFNIADSVVVFSLALLILNYLFKKPVKRKGNV